MWIEVNWLADALHRAILECIMTITTQSGERKILIVCDIEVFISQYVLPIRLLGFYDIFV